VGIMQINIIKIGSLMAVNCLVKTLNLTGRHA